MLTFNELHREPMYVFEIGVAILDCSWAPYSSTVFAAVTEEGKVSLVYLDNGFPQILITIKGRMKEIQYLGFV